MLGRGARKAAKKVASFTDANYQKGLRPGRFDIFKHLILNRVFQLMNQQQTSSWTYVDFAAGSGKLPVAGKSGALQTVYKHARADFEKKQLNVALPLIEAINKYNGAVDRKTALTPPLPGQEPQFYPTGAGLASLYLRPQDKAILFESEERAFQELQQAFGGDRRFKLDRKTISKQLFEQHLPPINRKGMVHIDVHRGVQWLIGAAVANNKKINNEAINSYLGYMGDLIAESCKHWPNATYVIPYGLSMLPHFAKVGPKPRSKGEDEEDPPDNRPIAHSEVPVPPLQFLKKITKSGVKQILIADMYMEDKEEGIACMIINPPQGLDHELNDALPKFKEMMTVPNNKKVWRRPRVVWPLQKDNVFDKEEQSMRMQWAYLNRVDLSDAAIEEYEAEVKAKDAIDDDYFDWYYNRDERQDFAEIGHEHDPELLTVKPKGDTASVSQHITEMKANVIGRTGGVVYPRNKQQDRQ